MADWQLFLIIVLAILSADVLRYTGQIVIVALWELQNEWRGDKLNNETKTDR